MSTTPSDSTPPEQKPKSGHSISVVEIVIVLLIAALIWALVTPNLGSLRGSGLNHTTSG